jgi:hypothetical protein
MFQTSARTSRGSDVSPFGQLEPRRGTVAPARNAAADVVRFGKVGNTNASSMSSSRSLKTPRDARVQQLPIGTTNSKVEEV